MREQQRILRGERLELVGRGNEGQPGRLRNFRGHGLAEALGRVEPGADRGAALRQLVEPGQRRLDPLDPERDLPRIARELVAQGQRGGVLRVRAADLDDVRPAFRLGLQHVAQSHQRGQQRSRHLAGAGDGDRAGHGVVGRLAHVDMVVGMDWAFGPQLAAQRQIGAVGDHLVGVHIALRARAGLPHHQREMIVEIAARDLLGRGDDGIGQPALEQPLRGVDPRRRRLDRAQRVDHRQRDALAANAEVLQAALRLCAPQPVCGDGDFAKGVGFDTGAGHGAGHSRAGAGSANGSGIASPRVPRIVVSPKGVPENRRDSCLARLSLECPKLGGKLPL